ncbi:MAG: MFS transporter [Pirellulaceae bacterium]
MSQESDRSADAPAHGAVKPSADLARDRGFVAHVVTQFLGAFNDNVFKQILLLMFVAIPTANGDADMQWVATFFFALPFILFSGFAGYLSDRHSKRRVIIASKLAEVGVMAIGMGGFIIYGQTGLTMGLVICLAAILFLMGAQSAFFGPGKYGILPEMMKPHLLPAANGFVLMTTFLAIIFGTALAGELLQSLHNQLWIAGLVCVGIGLAGTATSCMLRPVRPAFPKLKLNISHFGIPREVRSYLKNDRPLFHAIVVSSLFWMAASLVVMTVNAFGKEQLGLDDRWTARLNASVSIGIAAGSFIAGTISKSRFHTGVMKTGAWGLAICLVLLAPPGWNSEHLLGFRLSIVALIALGMFTGMFAVPLQVFIQTSPPQEIRGRMLATQNLLNWIGIMLSAAIYVATGRLLDLVGLPPSMVFATTALIMGSIALFYRPVDANLATGETG